MYQLYYFPECPFCQKVLNWIKDNNFEIELKNINETSENKEKLLELGGSGQVPFLYNQEKNIAMHESDDIIKYLSQPL